MSYNLIRLTLTLQTATFLLIRLPATNNRHIVSISVPTVDRRKIVGRNKSSKTTMAKQLTPL
jgi:hypothetical protein